VIHFIALLLAQAGPASAPVPVLTSEEAVRFVLAGAKKEKEAGQRIEGQSNEQIEAALTAALSGKSKLVYQGGHGVYVEYTAPDGRLRMWYPNNLNVVKGSWGVRRIGKKMRACFSYRDAINPVSQVYEPTECVPAVQTLSEANVLKSWDGDAFGLMQDRIPYRKGAMDMPEPGTMPPVARGE
jgi:hypothetical protein